MRRIVVIMLVILALTLASCGVAAFARDVTPKVLWSRFMTTRLQEKYNLSEETASDIMEEIFSTVEIDGQQYVPRLCQVQYNPENDKGEY